MDMSNQEARFPLPDSSFHVSGQAKRADAAGRDGPITPSALEAFTQCQCPPCGSGDFSFRPRALLILLTVLMLS